MIPASWAQYMYRFGVWVRVLLKPKIEPKKACPLDVQRTFCTVRPALMDVQKVFRTVRHVLFDVQLAVCTSKMKAKERGSKFNFIAIWVTGPHFIKRVGLFSRFQKSRSISDRLS